MAELPSGTVTFLFTDIEGSTGLWERHPEAMQAALARHDILLAGEVEGRGGVVVKSRVRATASLLPLLARTRRLRLRARFSAPW